MKKKLLGIVAGVALTGGAVLLSSSPAGAAHYCKETPSGIHQTNGNGNRGGSDGWRNSTAGIQGSPALFDCGAENPPPAPVRS